MNKSVLISWQRSVWVGTVESIRAKSDFVTVRLLTLQLMLSSDAVLSFKGLRRSYSNLTALNIIAVADTFCCWALRLSSRPIRGTWQQPGNILYDDDDFRWLVSSWINLAANKRGTTPTIWPLQIYYCCIPDNWKIEILRLLTWESALEWPLTWKPRKTIKRSKK